MRKKSASDLVNEAMKEIETREAKDIKKLYDNGSCNLIDIRDIRELWKTGTIENSVHIPRGMLEFWLDTNSSYYRADKFNNDNPIILFCAAGSRSALATKALKDMGFEKISHVRGGFQELQNAGFSVVEKKR